MVSRSESPCFLHIAPRCITHSLCSSDHEGFLLWPLGSKANDAGACTGLQWDPVCRPGLYRFCMERGTAGDVFPWTYDSTKEKAWWCFEVWRLLQHLCQLSQTTYWILFNWMQTHSGIQSASHVRSLEGLLFHLFASLAFLFSLLLFYYWFAFYREQ